MKLLENDCQTASRRPEIGLHWLPLFSGSVSASAAAFAPQSQSQLQLLATYFSSTKCLASSGCFYMADICFAFLLFCYVAVAWLLCCCHSLLFTFYFILRVWSMGVPSYTTILDTIVRQGSSLSNVRGFTVVRISYFDLWTIGWQAGS